MGWKYITFADLGTTIRKNFFKIPHDVDFVIAIPRSGMICGSMIAEFLNVPLIDIDSFCAGIKPTGGGRLRYWEQRHKDGNNTNKVLVVDDTVFNGTSKTFLLHIYGEGQETIEEPDDFILEKDNDGLYIDWTVNQ